MRFKLQQFLRHQQENVVLTNHMKAWSPLYTKAGFLNVGALEQS